MRCFLRVVFVLPLLATPLLGEQLTSEDCMAPDYKHEVYFFRDSKDSSDFHLGIRTPGMDTPLFSTTSNGWVSHFDSLTSRYNFKCLWSPDAKIAAIFRRGTKHSGDTSLYAVNDKEVQEIAFPDIMPRLGRNLTAKLRAIWITPELWLPHQQLLLSVEGTQQDEEHGNFRFILAIQLHQDNAGHFAASIVSFRLDRSVTYSVR